MAIGDRGIHDISGAALTAENGSRERLAWAVLLASFATWLALIILVPLMISNYLNHATRPLALAITANEGTIGLEDATGRRPAVLAGDPEQVVEGEFNLLTSTTDAAVVTVYTPDQAEVLARFNVSSNTSVEVAAATAPRFHFGDDDYRLALSLNAGILRLNLLPRDGERPLEVDISTPQGGNIVLRDAGQYTLDVDNSETWVSVQ